MKILISTGYGGSRLNGSEMVPPCSNLPKYPLSVYGATGSLINGTHPVICGGYDDDRNARDECYKLNPGVNISTGYSNVHSVIIIDFGKFGEEFLNF